MVTLLLILGVTELISYFGLRLTLSDATISDFRETQSQIAYSGSKFDLKPSEAIHPYLGWVLNPDESMRPSSDDQLPSVNALGFADSEFGQLRRSDDRVIIAILGGSVALQMSTTGEARFREVLAADPAFTEKEIVLVRLALSGYKQPQQLMALNYLLALGAEFDYVVNIDGYNEIALPASENSDQGVSVAYPRAWHVFMINVVDPRESDLAYLMLETRSKRQQLAASAMESRLNWSCTYNLVWCLRNMSLQNRMVDLEMEYRSNRQSQGRGFQADGPADSFDSDAELLASLTELWFNCSLQLHRLSDANGAFYIHVLQPNQYLPDSKPLSPYELENCIVPRQEYGAAVASGYPQLIEAGQDLVSHDVRFHDATLLFVDIEEDIYSDYFCHYNQRGNDMLAETVAKLVVTAQQ